MTKTVRVRILVAVDDKGSWSGEGWQGAKDDDVLNVAYGAMWGPLERDHHFVAVEADIPIPAERPKVAASAEGAVAGVVAQETPHD